MIHRAVISEPLGLVPYEHMLSSSRRHVAGRALR